MKCSMPTLGMLFPMEAQSLSERRDARRFSMQDRISECAAIVNSNADAWVVWCDLNDESKQLTASINGAVEITGSDDSDVKEKRLQDFAAGKFRVLVSKPSICGWGLNWQHAHHMAFVGVTDSYEAYYQAVRRCWRFGQKSSVNVHIFASESEGAVVANLKRKERDAASMAESLSAETRDAVMQEVTGMKRQTNSYEASHRVAVPSFWRPHELPESSCHRPLCGLSRGLRGSSERHPGSIHRLQHFFSPPFASLYTYSNSPRDMGNCRSHFEEFSSISSS